jgi:hypothetical protein
MRPDKKWKLLLLAAGLLAPLTAPGQTPPSDAIAREVSIFNYGVTPASGTDAISREVSVFNYGVTPASGTDAISREVSVFNSGVTLASGTDAISREVSLFNSGVTLASGTDAISREVSVFNSGVTLASGTDAISREVSLFNYGVPPVLFAIGSTNAFRDVPGQVPFDLKTVLDLTNLSLSLQTEDSYLQIQGVTPVSPELVSTVSGAANSNGHPIAFTVNPTAIPATNHVLGYLNFQGITNQDSAVVPLVITHFTATRASGQVVPAAVANGQVILIVSNSILTASARPQFGITLYGVPGTTYAIESTTNLASPDWQELERLLQSDLILTIPGLTNTAAEQFFRTRQVGP